MYLKLPPALCITDQPCKNMISKTVSVLRKYNIVGLSDKLNTHTLKP